MINFISYWTGSRDNSFGFMCYQGTITEASLRDRLFSQDAAVLFISHFEPSESNRTLISYVTDGRFKHEILDFPVQELDDIDKVWRYLVKQYDDVHLLSFNNLNDEFEI